MSLHHHNGTTPTQELEADIARQRDELAATVAHLQAGLDVKTRAHNKVEEWHHRATTDSGRPRPEVAAASALAVGLLIGLVYLKVRRTHR